MSASGSTATPAAPSPSWSDIHIVRDYAHAPEKIWRALTDPELVPLWTATGRGGKPVGFAPVVGTRFTFVGKPVPGWNGIVECEVVEVREPFALRYTWSGGDKNDDVTLVTNLLEPRNGGTRFTWDHTGFRGVGGFIVSQVLSRVRRRMLDEGLPPVLGDLDDQGRLCAGSAFKMAPPT